MILRIIEDIAIDEKVIFVPEGPEYVTIRDDQTKIICSARGTFVEEGELPVRYEMRNVRVLYPEPRNILRLIYHSLVWERKQQQKQTYDPFDLDLEPISYFDAIDDDLF